MKVTFAVIFSLIFAGCLAFPASKDDDKNVDTSVDFVPPVRHSPFGDQPVIDTGVISEGGLFGNPFGGLYETIENLMTRMRHQMNQLFNTQYNSSAALPGSGFPGIHFPPLPDLGKGNTTSVTKVIDGHKVIINETQYSNGDENVGSFFKVRIINIVPEDETTETDLKTNKPIEGTNRNRETESVENSHENEIPKNKEIEVGKNLPEKYRTPPVA